MGRSQSSPGQWRNEDGRSRTRIRREASRSLGSFRSGQSKPVFVLLWFFRELMRIRSFSPSQELDDISPQIQVLMARAMRDVTYPPRLRLYSTPEAQEQLEEAVPWFTTLLKTVQLKSPVIRRDLRSLTIALFTHVIDRRPLRTSGSSFNSSSRSSSFRESSRLSSQLCRSCLSNRHQVCSA